MQQRKLTRRMWYITKNNETREQKITIEEIVEVIKMLSEGKTSENGKDIKKILFYKIWNEQKIPKW